MTKEVSKRKRRPRKKNASTPGIGSTRVPKRVSSSRIVEKLQDDAVAHVARKKSWTSSQNKFDIDTPAGRIGLYQKVLSMFRGGAK